MIRVLQRIFPVLLTIWLALLPVTLVNAQTSTSGLDIRVSQISTLEAPDAMTMKVYFNVYDPKTGLPVLDTLAKTAQVDLPNTNYSLQAPILKPDVPIYIVLILDASGSMAREAEDLKKAAKQALTNSPDNAYFSVVQFDEQIKLLQDYTQNIAAVSYAIDQYQVSNKGTCLYDATYSAVESLQKAPPGRRAIVLFTDGRDENVSGQVCSKHTYLELSDFAQKSQVPVNTVGLSSKASNLNEVELKGIAASTGAFSVIAKTEDLAAGFQNIMNGLKAQWMVQADVYPKKGNNQVVMTMNLKDNNQISTTFTIASNTDYPGPPSPVTGQFAGLQFVPENQAYNIQLSMTSSELVDYVKVEVWDVKGGSKVAEFVFNGPQQNNVFKIPTDQLVVGRDYELRLTAVSKADKSRFIWATDSDGKKHEELVHPFTYDPTANLPAIEIQSVAQQQNNDLLLSVKTTNSQLIGGFNGWLVDENTNTKLQGSDFTSDTSGAATGTVNVPLSKAKIPAGKYTVVVRVLGKDKQVYSTAQYPGVVYQPTSPNLFQLLGTALIAAPIILFLVVAIIVGVVGFLMFMSSREKSMTGTPVLQGRLGGKLADGKSAGGPVIAVADDEPLLAQKRSAAPPPPAPVSPAPRQNPVSIPATPPRPAPVAPPSAEATMIAGGNSAEATLLASPGSPAPAFLVVINAPAGVVTNPRIALAQFPFVIGRTEGNLLLKEANVSRRHAEIRYDAAHRTYAITDLNSSNGTYINGQRLPAGQTAQLSYGVQIGFGPNISARFETS